MNNKRLLIFGTGFVAENYINHLHLSDDEKWDIKVIFNKHKLHPKHNHIEQACMNSNIISEFLEEYKPHYILCTHGSSFVSPKIKAIDSMEANALKTMDFLEKLSASACKNHLKRILVIGSASEYGKFYDKPIKEDFPLHPTSIYGLSKICLNNASKYFSEQGLPIVHVRQFNTIGPEQRECFVLPSFCKQIAKIEKLGIKPEITVGDLKQERDFIDIRDTCRAYSLLFQKGHNGNVYNVSSGSCVTIKELLDLVINSSHIKNNVKVVINKELLFQKNRLSKKLHADISKLTTLGFQTKYPLTQTVRDTLSFWRKNV